MQVEIDLINKCRKNDRKAQNALYKKCFGYLMAICLRYASNREDAESLLNQGFLKIVTQLDKYRDEVPFKTWMTRVMINSIIDDFRRDKKRREAMQTVDFQESSLNQQRVDFNEGAQDLDAEELEMMIQQLPETSRKVFNLYAIDGYTHKEIGELLDMADGTSKWHVSFARKTLQAMIVASMKKFNSILL